MEGRRNETAQDYFDFGFSFPLHPSLPRPGRKAPVFIGGKDKPVQTAMLHVGILGGGVDAGCNYASCSAGCKLFDWDCSTVNMAANVCSQGDNTASQVGEISVAGGKVVLGDASDNGSDRYLFDIAAYDIFPSGAVTLEITVNLSVIANGAVIFQAYFDADNSFKVSILTGAGNDVYVYHEGNNVAVTRLFDTNLSTSTEYSIIIKCDGTNGMAISTNGGGVYTTDATKTITTMTHAGTVAGGFRVGETGGVNLEGTIDDVRVSFVWREDI